MYHCIIICTCLIICSRSVSFCSVPYCIHVFSCYCSVCIYHLVCRMICFFVSFLLVGSLRSVLPLACFFRSIQLSISIIPPSLLLPRHFLPGRKFPKLDPELPLRISLCRLFLVPRHSYLLLGVYNPPRPFRIHR